MEKVEFNVGPNAVIQLGEDLYKNTYGVLIEYITNSYDADASIVEVKIDRSRGEIVIKDDGTGMSLLELRTNYLDVGQNRRKKNSEKTKKGRLVTGRKGFGKLACFGLFKNFRIETIKDGLKSKLVIDTGYDNGEFYYNALIDEEATPTTENNGTAVFLINNNQTIPENKPLAESIAKRLNIMYGDINEDTDEKFIIKLEDKIIDKTFRDEIVLNKDIKFKYNIPENLERFIKDKQKHEYIIKNGIKGVIIAREKTVNIKENKGIVLFARGKLCQEATYLDINPSNSYGYAHLYAEFDVDFIDNENMDNIGTDRTALKETETTKELFEVIGSIMKAYATLYDEDERKRKENAVDNFKEDETYKDIKKTIDSVSDKEIRDELVSLFNIKIKSSIKDTGIDTQSIAKFKTIAESVTPTYILKSEQISKDEPKDNIMTSYDHLMEYLRNKYNDNGNDGTPMIQRLFGANGANLSVLANCLPDPVKTDLRTATRQLGEAIVNIRNSIMHTNNRVCINDNISIETSKRFLIMVDLFIEIDSMFFVL